MKILGSDKVVGLKLKRCTSVFDKAGEFNPVYDDETTEKVNADMVILAIGQTPILDFAKKARVNVAGNRVAVEEKDLSTSVPGIFAGGDVVTGPASIISAIAQGRNGKAGKWRFGDGILFQQFDRVAACLPAG